MSPSRFRANTVLPAPMNVILGTAERLGCAAVIVPPLLRNVVRATSTRRRRGRCGDRTALAGLAFASPADALDRRATAATLRAIDAAHGGGFYDVPEDATGDLDAADVAFAGDAPVVDVQTHLVDPGRWHGPARRRSRRFYRRSIPTVGRAAIDPALIDGAAWAALVFGASETSVALLTSTPGTADVNVLTNAQIAAARDVVDRYAGTGRLLTHTIVHPNLGAAELDAMGEWAAQLRPSGWKAYTLWGPPTKASPTGGWFLDDDEVGFPFLERVRALGPRVVATHKGIGSGLPASSPRDIGPAAAAFPDITFVVYHSGYDLDAPADDESRGVDRLVREPRRRRDRTERQRVRGARHHVVPDAAPATRGRARARPVARRRSVPSASCGAPIARGTGRRSH